MNNIFQKNILALSRRNAVLAQKLMTYIPQELPQLVQENNTYNFLYKEKYIHNRLNPLGEAREIFFGAENTPVSIHLIYGLGLGYLFQVASLNSAGTVILYEPDLNVLWTAFTLVDFSADILKQNVYLADSFEDVTEAIYKNSNTKNSPLLLSVPTMREYNRQDFDETVLNLQKVVGSFSLDRKFTQQKFYPSLQMLISNLPKLMDETPLIRFKDYFKGKTAVVVSAGPTLDRNIEMLKQNRDKYVLFTVGTAVKTLYKNDLKPDFLCIIETYNSSKQVEGLDLKDVSFITEPYSNPELRDFVYKRRFSHISSNSPINNFWADICGEDSEEYISKGTVSYMALNCARILGFSKIVLVGQDLAYIEGQCYSKDSAYKDLICRYNTDNNKWEIVAKDFEAFSNAISSSPNIEERHQTAIRRLKSLNDSLYYVKGINGEMIPTESVYASFVKPLSEYTTMFNDRRYINTSLVGAQIDGFENLPLEVALKDSEAIESGNVAGDFEYNKTEIKNKFLNKLNELKSVKPSIEEGKKLLRSIGNDLKRYKSVNEDILKSLKKITVNYMNLSADFAEKSKMFDFITIADKIEIDYTMKMTREFNYENVNNLLSQLVMYYNNAESRIQEIDTLLTGVLNESFNTES